MSRETNNAHNTNNMIQTSEPDVYAQLLSRARETDAAARKYLPGGNANPGPIPMKCIQDAYKLLEGECSKMTLAHPHIFMGVCGKKDRFHSGNAVMSMLAGEIRHFDFQFDWMKELRIWQQRVDSIEQWMLQNARLTHQEAFRAYRVSCVAEWREAVVRGWTNSHHPNLSASWSEDCTTLIIEMKIDEEYGDK